MKPKPPTQAAIAAALNVSARRVRQLKADGMPCHSIESALAWRKAEEAIDSVEELRRERIRLVRAQAEKAQLELEATRGLYVEIELKKESDRRIAHAMQALLRGFESELPALCYGLGSIGEIKDVVKRHIRAKQNLLAERDPQYWPEPPLPGDI